MRLFIAQKAASAELNAYNIDFASVVVHCSLPHSMNPPTSSSAPPASAGAYGLFL